jgi:hypothetical protein
MDWPKPNEQLFRSDSDWELNACVNCYRPSLSAIADGYKQGANALADAAAERNATLDLVIYPIVFLYRQYLELKIKEIIETTRSLEREGRGYPAHHNLRNLWAEALRLVRKHYGKDTPNELANVQSCIDEFHLHDTTSSAFRYPTDKDGSANLRDIAHINLRNLYQTMGRDEKGVRTIY